jgi:hypothetical protein
MTDNVIVWRSSRASRRWYWRRTAPNGRTIGDSGQGYTRKWSAKRAARRAHRADLRSGAAVLMVRDEEPGTLGR